MLTGNWNQDGKRLFKTASALALMAISMVAATGCGSAVRSAGEVEKIQGKAVTADGTPVGNVLLVLQPTQNGYVTELEVSEDGTFSGDAIAGKYVYYFAPSKKVKKPMPKAVSTNFTEPKMENLVDVKPGTDIVCQIQ